MNYTVKNGESITDVVLNSTGTLDNWEEILDINGFDTWTPFLLVGQIITIPNDAAIQTNTLNQLKVYPACNNSEVSDLDLQIAQLIAKFANRISFRADNNTNATMDSILITADYNG